MDDPHVPFHTFLFQKPWINVSVVKWSPLMNSSWFWFKEKWWKRTSPKQVMNHHRPNPCVLKVQCLLVASGQKCEGWLHMFLEMDATTHHPIYLFTFIIGTLAFPGRYSNWDCCNHSLFRPALNWSSGHGELSFLFCTFDFGMFLDQLTFSGRWTFL